MLTDPGPETEPTSLLDEPDAWRPTPAESRHADEGPSSDDGATPIPSRGRVDPVALVLLVLLGVEIGVATGSFVLAPLLVGVGGPAARARALAVLAAALLTMLWRAARAGRPDEPEELVGVGAQPLRGPRDPADRLTSVLGDLDDAVAGRTVTAAPLTVHIGSRVVEVFWDGPPPPARPPWIAPASGWVWEADAHQLEPGPRRSPTRWAALVALGTTPTGSLWLNLAAFRVVALLGDATDVARAADALRSQLQHAAGSGALELVVVPGVDGDGAPPDAALSALWQRRARAGRGARRGVERGPHPAPTRPLVVAISPGLAPQVVGPVLDAVRGDRGVTCLVPASAPRADLCLTLSGHRIHVPFLAEVPVRVGWDPPPTVAPAPELDPPATRPAAAPPVADPTPVRVRLLGRVTVEGTAATLPAKGVEIVAYLACHRDGARDDEIQAALWPQRPLTHQSWNTRVSITRRDLGRDTDGTPRLGRFRQHVGRLAPSVRCDVDELDAARRSAAAATPAQQPDTTRRLCAALELVRGRPFDAPTPYPWASHEQHVERAERIVVDAAHHLSAFALAAGDTGRARWAAEQGLLAVPASELLREDRRRARVAAGDLPVDGDDDPTRAERAASFARIRAAVGALDPCDPGGTAIPGPPIDQ